MNRERSALYRSSSTRETLTLPACTFVKGTLLQRGLMFIEDYNTINRAHLGCLTDSCITDRCDYLGITVYNVIVSGKFSFMRFQDHRLKRSVE